MEEVQPKVAGNRYKLDVRTGGILEADEELIDGQPVKEGKYFNPHRNTSLFKKLPQGYITVEHHNDREDALHEVLPGLDPMANMMSERPSTKYHGLFLSNVEFVINKLPAPMVGTSSSFPSGDDDDDEEEDLLVRDAEIGPVPDIMKRSHRIITLPHGDDNDCLWRAIYYALTEWETPQEGDDIVELLIHPFV